MSLTVTADIPAGTDLLGKSVTDLQSGVTIGESTIHGELKYVTGYTGFSGESELQEGNYIALHCECDAAESITAELVGGDYGPVTLDEDGIIIFRIKNKSQKVKITANVEGYDSVTKLYTLTGITLDEA